MAVKVALKAAKPRTAAKFHLPLGYEMSIDWRSRWRKEQDLLQNSKWKCCHFVHWITFIWWLLALRAAVENDYPT